MRVLVAITILITSACSAPSPQQPGPQPVPCAGCAPPVARIVNPVVPDGGISDGGVVTQETCSVLCPRSLGCDAQRDDGGVVVYCSATCGC